MIFGFLFSSTCVFQCIHFWNISSTAFSALLWHFKMHTYTFWKHLGSKGSGMMSGPPLTPILEDFVPRGLL